MAQQTAIQYFIEQMAQYDVSINKLPYTFKSICEQALELEKQQIINAHKEGNKFNGWALKHESETYYNRTFQNNKQ
jgi:hypothetical protein